MTHLYPYRTGSKGATALATELGFKRIRRKNSQFVGGEHLTVVNWGSSSTPAEVERCQVLNPAHLVARVSNKLTFFNLIAQHSYGLVPSHATSWAAAVTLLEAGPVVCRTLLNAAGGRGIVIAHTPEELVEAKLYVSYFNKTEEYRVHIGKDGVFDVQKKGRKNEDRATEEQSLVRNHENGWVFIRDGFIVPVPVIDTARSVFDITGLDFGALDVVYNRNTAEAQVLEVNTAPGLEGSSPRRYAEMLTSSIL